MTRTLARAAAETSWATAPGAVRDRVVDLVADCVSVTALGASRPELRRLVDTHDRWTPVDAASVLGSTRGWPSSAAMSLNAGAATADQLQDGHRPARGHPAAHVVPAVLATAAEVDLTGAEVLSAVLAGYETGVRVSRAMDGTSVGIHDIGTWGQVSVSVAVARLLAPGDVEATRRALELSAAAVLLTDAQTVFAGTTGSHAFLGASVQLGAGLAVAAVAGTRTPARVNGAPPAHGGRQRLGSRGPVSGHRQRDLGEVRSTAATAAFDAVAHGELAARFSVPTSVAVALMTGRLDETTMTDRMVTSAGVRDLASRVRVVHDPALDAGYPAGRPAQVRVLLADGTVRDASTARPRGDAERAFTREELAAKASRLLTHVFGGAGALVLQAVHGLAVGGRARDVGRAVREAAAAGHGDRS